MAEPAINHQISSNSAPKQWTYLLGGSFLGAAVGSGVGFSLYTFVFSGASAVLISSGIGLGVGLVVLGLSMLFFKYRANKVQSDKPLPGFDFINQFDDGSILRDDIASAVSPTPAPASSSPASAVLEVDVSEVWANVARTLRNDTYGELTPAALAVPEDDSVSEDDAVSEDGDRRSMYSCLSDDSFRSCGDETDSKDPVAVWAKAGGDRTFRNSTYAVQGEGADKASAQPADTPDWTKTVNGGVRLFSPRSPLLASGRHAQLVEPLTNSAGPQSPTLG